MKISRKAAISLLICILLFAGFCVFAFTSLFDVIETRFYDSAILNELNNDLDDDTDFIDSYISDLQKRFDDILHEGAIRRSFWVNQSSEDIYERSRIFASLGVSLPGLQWVRFVDSGGNRIHYSNNPDDQIITNDGTILYKNYPEVTGYLPFDRNMLSGVNMEHILFDDENERLVFYYPFYDSMDIQRGEALFSVSIRAFSESLAENRQIKVSDNVSVISDPDGIAIGIPLLETNAVKQAISSVWASGGAAISRVYTPQSDPLTLLSAKTSQGIFIGHLVPEKLFAFPDVLKALLVAAVFITLFVVLFLIFNVKPDAVAVVQSRLKELQVSLMHEYYQLMGDMDWAVWRRELEQRREDVKSELCRGVKIKKGSGIESYINSFFDRSWDSLLAAIGSRTGMITTFDEAKLEAILGRVLGSSRPPSYIGDAGKTSIQDDRYERIQDYGDDILDDGVAGIDDHYDDIEELESADEIGAKDAPAVVGAGERYQDIEELEPADEGNNYDHIEELEAADEPQADYAQAGEGERYDEIEELEPADEPQADYAQAGAGERYDEIEELEPADEPQADYAQAGEGERYDEIEELEPADSPESSENVALPEGNPEIAGKNAPVEATGSEGDAWLNLAGGAASMEPSEIWAELADVDKAADTETSETGEAVGQQEAEERPPMVNSDILEWDPFGEEDFGGVTESDSGGPAEHYTTNDYGEFIPAAADLNAGNFNIASLYDVEEFADADIDEEQLYNNAYKKDEADYEFDHPQHQQNLDEIARQIEFTAADPSTAPPAGDLKLDVRSPLDEIFSAKTINALSAPAAKLTPAAKLATVAAAKTTKNVREIKPHKPLKTADQTPSPPHYRFFSQKSGDLEYIEAEEDENESSLIKKRGGVDYIDSALLKKDSPDGEKIDPKMKSLVDSVLQNR